MPTQYSIAQRTATHNGLFAGLACALALALTAGPALAQTTLDRVVVNGKVFEGTARFDVRQSCANVDAVLQEQLANTWFRDPTPSELDVTFAVQDGQVKAVRASGGPMQTNREVRRAVRLLECSRDASGTSIYRMQLAFVSPEDATAPAASAQGPARIVITASR